MAHVAKANIQGNTVYIVQTDPVAQVTFQDGESWCDRDGDALCEHVVAVLEFYGTEVVYIVPKKKADAAIVNEALATAEQNANPDTSTEPPPEASVEPTPEVPVEPTPEVPVDIPQQIQPV